MSFCRELGAGFGAGFPDFPGFPARSIITPVSDALIMPLSPSHTDFHVKSHRLSPTPLPPVSCFSFELAAWLHGSTNQPRSIRRQHRSEPFSSYLFGGGKKGATPNPSDLTSSVPASGKNFSSSSSMSNIPATSCVTRMSPASSRPRETGKFRRNKVASHRLDQPNLTARETRKTRITRANLNPLSRWGRREGEAGQEEG